MSGKWASLGAVVDLDLDPLDLVLPDELVDVGGRGRRAEGEALGEGEG